MQEEEKLKYSYFFWCRATYPAPEDLFPMKTNTINDPFSTMKTH
jgi:hypothetical protein